MNTRIVEIRKGKETPEIKEVAEMLRDGALVAFPTETVYGLGVSADSEESVKKVFHVKGRSSMNPLTLHLPSVDMIAGYVKTMPEGAVKLIDKFLPGPLMLLFEKAENISDTVTSGSLKVGIRVPSHPVATALLSACEVPVVATSANISGRFSPVTSAHVIEEMKGRIDVIVTCPEEEALGIESTIVDVTSNPFRITRSGFITQDEISRVLGYAPMLSNDNHSTHFEKFTTSMRIILVDGDSDRVTRKMPALSATFPAEYRTGFLVTEETAARIGPGYATKVMGSRRDMEGIARNLFSQLRAFEHEEMTVVLVEALAKDGLGWAIMERLLRSAAEIVKAE
ncbi:MAG: L-threonylcarbamoyladenylate synthase [Candidatus Xenobiia bacterium LiM19]